MERQNPVITTMKTGRGQESKVSANIIYEWYELEFLQISVMRNFYAGFGKRCKKTPYLCKYWEIGEIGNNFFGVSYRSSLLWEFFRWAIGLVSDRITRLLIWGLISGYLYTNRKLLGNNSSELLTTPWNHYQSFQAAG